MAFRLFRLAAAAFILSGLALSAQADDLRTDDVRTDDGRPRAVIELFTSQGCNSCPPADELLSELAQAGNVVALSYHVDYWDYLGWKDTLASAENTGRQKEYNSAFGNRSVYTPQAVVNGRHHVNGAKRAKLEAAIARKSARGLSVDVDVDHAGDAVVIRTGDAAPGQREAQIVMVYFNPPTAVEIGRGENEGRRIVYYNAVTSFHTVGMWHGKAARFELPATEVEKKGPGGCAVLVQEIGKDGLPGAIVGAAILTRPTS